MPLRDQEIVGENRIFTILSDDVAAITSPIAALPDVLFGAVMILSCLLYLAVLSWRLLATVIVSVTLGALSLPIIFASWRSLFDSLRRHLDDLQEHFRAIAQGAKELKLHRSRRAAFVTELLHPTMRSLSSSQVKVRGLFAGAAGWQQMLVLMTMGVIVALPTHLSGITSQNIGGCLLWISLMSAQIAMLYQQIPAYRRADVAFDNIESFGLSIDAIDDNPDKENAAALSRAAEPWQCLQIVEVTHRFIDDDGRNAFTLGPLTFTIRSGELVFVTGGNGSGKTTLAKILAGLYHPDSGELQLDGVPVTQHNSDEYRQNVSAVFFDFYIFSRLLGIEGAALDIDQRVSAYLAELNLRDKVTVENGVLSRTQLSQGQRRRLALLMLLLDDRSLCILDEPSADQDSASRERLYSEVLPRLKAARRTVVVVTHDDRYFKIADRVLRLDRGQLV